MVYDSRSQPRKRHGYTQNEEERFLVQHARGSRFLDIGAYDGETFSSTRELVNKGWSGVYVEPNPLILDKLQTIASVSKSDVLPVAVGTTCCKTTFYAVEDLVGSLNEDHVEKWKKNNGLVFDPVTVDVIDVATLAERIGYNYDVLNLDVEGLNWDVYKQFDFSKWTFNTVCVEYDNKFDDIRVSLERAGFTLLYISPENIVATR
jgi:FkbM family methyltransferase